MDEAVEKMKGLLILRAGVDVLREAWAIALRRLVDALTAVKGQLVVSEDTRREVANELVELEKDSRDTYMTLMREFENERRRLILGIDAQADGPNLAAYVRAEIGREGDELLRRVDHLITSHAEPLAGSARRRMENIGEAVRFEQEARKKVFETVEELSSGVAAWLAGQGTRAIADAILKMNRSLKFVRFRPWGAVKLAGRFQAVGKVLAMLGPILEVADAILEIWTQRQLTKQKGELTLAVDEFFRQLRDELTLEELRVECCPGLEEARDLLAGLVSEQEGYRAACEKLERAKLAIDDEQLEGIF